MLVHLGDTIANTARTDRLRSAAGRKEPVRWSRQGDLWLYGDEGGPLLPHPSLPRSGHLAVKRLLDVCVSLAALMFLAPLLLIIAVVIKTTDQGPVFFVQSRPGVNGRMFKMYKFRTLFADLCDAQGIVQVRVGDHRVTPVGAFLRRTSIDELPQLFNVLMGDMSLVGPRPHCVGMLAAGLKYEELLPYYHLRHAMPPGISGWAQANGLRGPTTDEKRARARVDHDIAYIQNFSIWLDLKIIWLTIIREFIGGSGL